MAVVKITVSELKHAYLDPNWRARWLRGEKPPTQGFARAGAVRVCGITFHKLAADFVAWLASRAAAQETASLRKGALLWQRLFRQRAEAEIDKLTGDGEVESALFLSGALQSFCERLSALKS
jgi:hypothetical protein